MTFLGNSQYYTPVSGVPMIIVVTCYNFVTPRTLAPEAPFRITTFDASNNVLQTCPT